MAQDVCTVNMEEQNISHQNTPISQPLKELDIANVDKRLRKVADIMLNKLPTNEILQGQTNTFGSARKEQEFISSIANWVAYIPHNIAKIQHWPPGHAGSQKIKPLMQDLNPTTSRNMKDMLKLLQGFYATDLQVSNYQEEFACVKGIKGYHIYTLADIDTILYDEHVQPHIKGLYPLQIGRAHV